MATLTSRTAVRERIVTLLQQITTLVAVYDHQTKDFGRRSPIATVHSDGTRTLYNPGSVSTEFHRFWVTTLWRRENAATVEDKFDDLQKAVRQKLIDNTLAPTYWRELTFGEDFSQPDYVIIDGVMYRWERISVIVEMDCG